MFNVEICDGEKGPWRGYVTFEIKVVVIIQYAAHIYMKRERNIMESRMMFFFTWAFLKHFRFFQWSMRFDKIKYSRLDFTEPSNLKLMAATNNSKLKLGFCFWKFKSSSFWSPVIHSARIDSSVRTSRTQWKNWCNLSQCEYHVLFHWYDTAPLILIKWVYRSLNPKL
jgi:hypothetical protein